ncbi:MAG TPA: hypothetical protein VFF69_01900 [Phycisphaerales bacterium]|nr:hypothetical protein [Phycisphaerales bacterium]
MNAPKRTTPAESARTAPWSTRAVILIAFAIQLMPVSERLTPGPSRQADRLMAIDGRLAAIWMAEGAAHAAPAAGAPGLLEGLAASERGAAPPGTAPALPRRLERVGCALLPIPPPMSA